MAELTLSHAEEIANLTAGAHAEEIAALKIEHADALAA